MSRKAAVYLLPQAMQSIHEQTLYYRQHASSKVAANWKRAVNEAARSLKYSPERGEIFASRLPLFREVRKIPLPGFPNHLLFYRYDRDAHAIFVVLVTHGARDLGQLPIE